MSDNEYYSDDDSNSGSEYEEDQNVKTIIKSKTILPTFKKQSNTIDEYENDEDSNISEDDISDNDNENDINDVQIGGVEDVINDSDNEEENDLEEGEIDDDAEDSDEELDEDGEPIKKIESKKSKPNIPKKEKQLIIEDNDFDDDEDDEYDENYLQKFDNEITKNYINEYHPESLLHNYDEIAKMTIVVRNSDNIIIDPFHKTIPFLTKYERARVLGQRAKQIETGSKPFINVPETIIDSHVIAELELKQKKIPFIIRRPIPGGGCEYWNLKDLELILY